MENRPLVSIIIAVYNGEKYLEKSIKSVINQTYLNIEYIIIDANSTDNTVNIIKKYQEHISYWISEDDEGVYDAMNKGLAKASGDIIAILNADDYYLKDAVISSVLAIDDAQVDYSIANASFANAYTIKPISMKKGVIYQEMPYPHVSAFISKRVYDTVGKFDTSFKIAGDHDMALRIHLAGFSYTYLDQTIAYLEDGGISSSTDSNKESMRVAIKNSKPKILAYGRYYYQIITIKLSKILPSSIKKLIKKFKSSRFED